MATSDTSLRERVLVVMPFGRDAALAARVLASAGLRAETVEGVAAACAMVDEGAGALLLTEEALDPASLHALTELLERQAPWSDLPVLACTRSGGVVSRESLGRLGPLSTRGSVTLIERPMHARTLAAAAQAALRARRRQYQVRDLVEQLEAMRRAAEESSRLKDEFLATVSHELRTPLQAMLGWASLLLAGRASGEQRTRALETIERNARAQAQLVEDLLDVSRVITGNLRLTLAPVRVDAALALAIDSARPAAHARGVSLSARVAPEVPAVMGDAARIQQVLWNLLSNAVKFSHPGGRVEVTVDGDGDAAVVTVDDDGEGFTDDFKPYLFERFRQRDGSSTRAHGGLGLGLAICRSLVELHGGSIEAESGGLGAGARFTVRFPTTGPRSGWDDDAPTPVAEAARGSLEGVSVLVVDDEPDTRELIELVLEGAGARVTTACDAAQGYDALVRGRPDVLVSDIGMPGGDGYALIRRVRALPTAEGGATPAIAVTAYAQEEDQRRALEAGFDRHLSKPVDAPTLTEALASLRESARG